MKSIIIKKLQFSNYSKEDLLVQIGQNAFSSEQGEGVRVSEENPDYVACHYLVESSYQQDTYNYETGDFEKVNYTRVDKIPFFIDFEQHSLDILGNKQQAAKVIEFIGKISFYRLPIADAPIDLIKLIDSWRKNGVSFNITRLKLSDYVFFDNIVGNCVLNLTGYPKAMEVINTYKKQIVNVSFNILLDDPCTITFYKSGAISIYKDIENIDLGLIRLLKFGTEGGEPNA